MKLLIVTPAPAHSRTGNRTTALRWAKLLRRLGHSVRMRQQYEPGAYDALIALHADKSAGAVMEFDQMHPGKPILVALTGTDIYQAGVRTDDATLERADRLITLQEKAADQVPERLRWKVRVIHQSAAPPPAPPFGRERTGREQRQTFDICIVAHLRMVKDPLLAAQAARLLPGRSRIRIVHLGAALTPEWEEKARSEQRENPRYHWLGKVPRSEGLAWMQRSRLLAVTSKTEGGANVISEAIVAGIPVISSRIDGSIGLLGAGYPGYFPIGDTEGLAGLMWRTETDVEFYNCLHRLCAERKYLFDPDRELEHWRALLREFL